MLNLLVYLKKKFLENFTWGVEVINEYFNFAKILHCMLASNNENVLIKEKISFLILNLNFEIIDSMNFIDFPFIFTEMCTSDSEEYIENVSENK